MRRRDFITELQTGGLVIVSDPFFNSRIGQLAGVTLEHSIPAIYQYLVFTAAGGLISYGSNLIDPFQSAGVYAGHILIGEKAVDLSVQQSTKVDLINVKSAKLLVSPSRPHCLAVPTG